MRERLEKNEGAIILKFEQKTSLEISKRKVGNDFLELRKFSRERKEVVSLLNFLEERHVSKLIEVFNVDGLLPHENEMVQEVQQIKNVKQFKQMIRSLLPVTAEKVEVNEENNNKLFIIYVCVDQALQYLENTL